MFEIEIENPCDESIQFVPTQPLYDFEMIELKFKKTFYGSHGWRTDRNGMKAEALDTEYQNWMDTYLTMTNGLIEFTIPKKGKYQIIQKSRSSNQDVGDRKGPALGVTTQFECDFEKVQNVQIWNCRLLIITY